MCGDGDFDSSSDRMFTVDCEETYAGKVNDTVDNFSFPCYKVLCRLYIVKNFVDYSKLEVIAIKPEGIIKIFPLFDCKKKRMETFSSNIRIEGNLLLLHRWDPKSENNLLQTVNLSTLSNGTNNQVCMPITADDFQTNTTYIHKVLEKRMRKSIVTPDENEENPTPATTKVCFFFNYSNQNDI